MGRNPTCLCLWWCTPKTNCCIRQPDWILTSMSSLWSMRARWTTLVNFGRQSSKCFTFHHQKYRSSSPMSLVPWHGRHVQPQIVSAVKQGVEGSSSRGSGHGAEKVSLSVWETTHMRHGTPGTTVKGSWTLSIFNGIRVESSRLTWCRLLGQQRCGDVKSIQDVHPCPSSLADGVIGRWGQSHGWIRLLPRCHHENKDRLMCEQVHREHYVVGWEKTQPTISPAHAKDAANSPATSVPTAHWECALNARWMQQTADYWSHAARSLGEARPRDSQFLRYGLGTEKWRSSESSWDSQSRVGDWSWLLSFMPVLVLAVLGFPGVTGRPRMVWCMDAASSSSGWAPHEAVQMVEEGRVRSWRTQHKLEDDGDFAFYFIDYDQALTNAGRAVAHAWLEARHASTGGMLQQMEQALRDVDSRAPATFRPLQIKPKQRKRPLRLRENQADAPEAIQRRVNALCQVWREAEALKPSGHLSPDIMESWARSCERLAQRHVTQAEPVTVTNAISTFRELRESLIHRGRSFPPQAVDIDYLLHEQTSAPVRALNSLKWLSKQGSLNWPLSHVALPVRTQTREPRGQAVAVSPLMLAELEEHIERRWELNDETWTCLLASWMVAVGVVRHRHLERSTPRKWTRSFVHFRCAKGKQRRNRGGFDFAVPSTFMTGWCWAERWHPLWSALPADVQRRSGICFSAAGQHWPIAEAQRAARDVFFNKIEDVNLLTTYSWRRLMPTVAHTIHVAPEVANALGDWQDASKVDATSKMPLHYSSVRYVESLKSKARCLGALQALQFESWELIPEEAIEQANLSGTKLVQQLIPRDSHILWSLPLSNTETASRFAASQQMKARAVVVRARAARDAAAMPRSVMNKQVSAFLRDNTLLSGRVCGGKHAAKDCREKRFIAVEASSPGPAPKRRPRQPDHPPPQRRSAEQASLPAREEPSKVGRVDLRASPNQGRHGRSEENPASRSRGSDQHLPVVEDEGEVKFDRLATTKGKTAQCPTRIYVNSAGGAIWLGGLPTVDTAPHFPVISMQIQCFDGDIKKRGGIILPDAFHMVVLPTDREHRMAQWQAAFPVIKATVQAGEEILVHCIAGRHRAAAIGVLLRAIFSGESITQSDSWISQRRDIELHRIAYDRGVGSWIKEALQKAQVGPAWPALSGFIATSRSNLHLRTVDNMPLCAHKQSAEKALSRLSYPIQCTRISEALAWNRPLCTVCLNRAPASWRVKLKEA